jgi:DNA-binding NtrC family response regulator
VDIPVDDHFVSGQHAELRLTPGGVQLHDLGSRNGTKVGGIEVPEALIDQSTALTIGETVLRLEIKGGQRGRAASAARGRFGDVLADSSEMHEIFDLAERLSPSDLTVTILGETGTGKDLLARAMHGASPRAKGSFVIFDCGAAAPSLIESQLFGHVKGSFTGAISDHPGAFERAHGGTLFLDEIGELAIELQPKLLRALESRRIQRIGGTGEIDVDVRIIAATHRDLEADVESGKFRRDLLFRLNAAVLKLPPLRERQGDIVLLAKTFARSHGSFTLSKSALDRLLAHDWPGNVRELANVVASACAISDGPDIEAADLVSLGDRKREPTLEQVPLAGLSLDEIERAAIVQTLEKCGGNKTKAAKLLGIATSTLYEKLKKLREG